MYTISESTLYTLAECGRFLVLCLIWYDFCVESYGEWNSCQIFFHLQVWPPTPHSNQHKYQNQPPSNESNAAATTGTSPGTANNTVTDDDNGESSELSYFSLPSLDGINPKDGYDVPAIHVHSVIGGDTCLV